MPVSGKGRPEGNESRKAGLKPAGGSVRFDGTEWPLPPVEFAAATSESAVKSAREPVPEWVTKLDASRESDVESAAAIEAAARRVSEAMVSERVNV